MVRSVILGPKLIALVAYLLFAKHKLAMAVKPNVTTQVSSLGRTAAGSQEVGIGTYL